MSWETVTLAREGGVATLTVDRPERLNALNEATLTAIREAAADARGARALVVTGAGDDAFVAGADIEHMRDLSPPEAQAYADHGHRAMRAVAEFPAPTVAAVNGYALGGGLELALACDLRIASERATLGQTEVDLGVIPGWGGTQRLAELVGDETARRMLYFGERLDATDAHERGLVGEVVAHDDLDDRVADLVDDLRAQPRHALAAAKAAMDARHEMDRSAALSFERRTFSGLFGTADQREAMAAFLEDREPDLE